jgi:hypothetical protein
MRRKLLTTLTIGNSLLFIGVMAIWAVAKASQVPDTKWAEKYLLPEKCFHVNEANRMKTAEGNKITVPIYKSAESSRLCG